MAIVTTTGHIDNALRFASLAGRLYIGVGKSDNDVNEGVPEDVDATGLDTVIGVKRPSTVSLAYLVPEGTDPMPSKVIHYQGKTYALCNARDAYEKKGRFVYLSTLIKSDDFGAFKYDQVGLYKDVQFKPSVTGDAIKPENITNYGDFLAYENRKLISSQQGINIEEQMIFEC
jgi:hypothetical protein